MLIMKKNKFYKNDLQIKIYLNNIVFILIISFIFVKIIHFFLKKQHIN
jgi:hypothetical protein